MREVLEQFNVSTASVARAVQSVTDLHPRDISALATALALTVEAPEETEIAVKYAVHGILNDVPDDKLNEFVAFKMLAYRKGSSTGALPKPSFTGKVVEVTVNEEETVKVAEVNADSVEVGPVRKRGRPKMKETAYDRAVKMIEDADTGETAKLLKLLTSSGIAEASAKVYLWKYRKANA